MTFIEDERMRTVLILSFLALGITAPGVDADIYKTVDKDGNVIFTDVPTSDKSESVKLSKTSEYSPVAADKPKRTTTRRANSSSDDEQPLEPISYTSLAIVTPKDASSFRKNDGSVSVVVQSHPALAADHEFELLLDGIPLERGTETNFVLNEVERGSHTLTARILDERGEIILESDPSAFHLQRVSAIAVTKAPGASRNLAPRAPNAPKPKPGT